MLPPKLLKDKIALITGCNKGIGKSILEVFAQNGASIIACTRKENADFTKYLNDISEKYDITIKSIYFDLTKEEEIKNAMKSLVVNNEIIDVLVNNAGVAHGNFLQMTPINKIKEIFEINFFSHLLIIQYLTKIMFRRKTGTIINIASIAGLDSYPGYSAYGSSKAALIYATKTLSQEFAQHNVRINAIAPSLTETEMAGMMEIKALDNMINRSAMQRMAKKEEIANVALFLASDMSSFINGQVIRVDGGM